MPLAVKRRSEVLPSRPRLVVVEKPPTVEEHIGLARDIALRYTPRHQEVEDTEQYSDALLGLLKACRSYTSSLGFTFATWATKCINNEIWLGYRKRSRQSPATCVEAGVLENCECPEACHWQALDILFDPHPDDTAADLRNKEALRRHYLEGDTWQEIGSGMGVTRNRAYQYGQEAIDLLRTRYPDLWESFYAEHSNHFFQRHS